MDQAMNGASREDGSRLGRMGVCDVSLPRVEVSALLGAGREVIVVHKDCEYRLRLTTNDKLILTK